MKEMYYYQIAINKEIGEACRKARVKAGLTQDGLIMKIQEWHLSFVKQQGDLSEMELDEFIFSGTATGLSAKKQKALSNWGIDELAPDMKNITISRYENGSVRIPAYYVYLVMQICGEFDIPHII